MSIHKSLVPTSALRRHRNVLKRAERLELLKKDGRWSDDKSLFGLAKVRNILMKAKKAKKEEAAATAEGAAAPVAGATPAAGAAPAAGAKGAATPAAGAKPAAKGAAPAAGAKPGAASKKEEKKK